MNSGSSSQSNQSKTKLRIGTRTSSLAIAQVNEVINRLKNSGLNTQFEIVPIKTSGDKIQDQNLAEFGGKGLFVKEIEEALINKKIDFAVHSAKDVPPIIHPSTEIVAFTKRADSRDCLVSVKFSSIYQLPKDSVIGTSSARRKAFLLRNRPDLQVVNLRGNIDTRLAKLNSNNLDAAILAVAGIERLGKKSAIQTAIKIEEMLPAGGQGSLAIQILKNQPQIFSFISPINDLESQICIKCERAFLRELGASCYTPVGVNAKIHQSQLELRTAIISYEGEEIFETFSICLSNLEEAVRLGIAAAKKTKNEANALLQKILK